MGDESGQIFAGSSKTLKPESLDRKSHNLQYYTSEPAPGRGARRKHLPKEVPRKDVFEVP